MNKNYIVCVCVGVSMPLKCIKITGGYGNDKTLLTVNC